MKNIIIDALYFAWLLVPSYLANIMPVMVIRLFPKWTAPLDFGLRIGKGKRRTRLLGKNKTWRGFICGIVVAIVIASLQSRITPDYPPWLLWGLAIGAGALLGDALASFVKRRLRMPPGKRWIPFDQIDHVIGAIALGSLIWWPGWTTAIIVIIGTFAGHILINHIGYALKLRSTPW